MLRKLFDRQQVLNKVTICNYYYTFFPIHLLVCLQNGTLLASSSALSRVREGWNMQVIIIQFKGVTNTLKTIMQMKNCLQHKYPATTVREGCAANTATRMEKEHSGSPTGRTLTNRLMAEYEEKSLNLRGWAPREPWGGGTTMCHSNQDNLPRIL